MEKKYTTRDLKREVDRLNKKHKKSGKNLAKFVFGKDPYYGEYYIGTRHTSKNTGLYKHMKDQPISKSRDIGEVIEDVRSKDFKKRSDKYIEEHHQYVLRDWIDGKVELKKGQRKKYRK